MKNTYDRSCEHWSEGSRQEMEDFYSLASVDYEYLANAHDWKSWLTQFENNSNTRTQLLDIACGSGKFPTALLKHPKINLNEIKKIDYSLLDPSSFSIEETAKILKYPFEVKNKYKIQIQDFNSEKKFFDLLWAVHALYAIPRCALRVAIIKLLSCLKGNAFIAHGCSDGHYVKFYKLFNKAFKKEESFPYISAEDIISTLEILNVDFSYKYLNYTNGGKNLSSKVIEGYLQRCVFDDNVSLKEMMNNPLTGDYLNDCQKVDEWKFSQTVMLIFFSKTKR